MSEKRYFGAFDAGDRFETGSRTVTEAEMVEFAQRYDPQPIHLDPAAESPFDGLIASGWLTAAVTMELLVEGFLSGTAATAALGVDELRWPAPVRPGDELRAAVEVTAVEEWEPRPDQGLVRARVETERDDGETVLRMVPLLLVRRRGYSDSADS